VILALVLLSAPAVTAGAQDGPAALAAFHAWHKLPDNASLSFGRALDAYRSTLKAKGLSDEAAERMIRIIVAHDEATLYDRVYAERPTFNTEPNAWLVAAVEGLTPGRALDVAMGQGRNALFLASKGWDVTGFDPSAVGLARAREEAARRTLKIATVHASDEEFDFGVARWDLIAIIYSLEKRSVRRVHDAVKPGGMVVVEAGHTDQSGTPFEYESNELLQIFSSGFRVLHYEEVVARHDWGDDKPVRLVRLVAQKLP
jgi:SAM-dependent methyltransferase